jgi:hypothetical protein
VGAEAAGKIGTKVTDLKETKIMEKGLLAATSQSPCLIQNELFVCLVQVVDVIQYGACFKPISPVHSVNILKQYFWGWQFMACMCVFIHSIRYLNTLPD